MRLSAAALLSMLLPLPGQAEDMALVLGTGDYRTLPDLPGGADLAGAAGGLEAAGFRVLSLRDGTTEAVAPLLADVARSAPEVNQLVVALAGRFVTDGTRTWWLAADAGTPALFGVEARAVSVESLLAVLARVPVRAVLLLGADPDAASEFDPWLREGLGPVTPPEGVAVLAAPPDEAARILAGPLAERRAALADLVGGPVRALGSLPEDGAPPRAGGPDDDALWEGTVALGTLAAYRDYLAAYPEGRRAPEARAAIAALLSEPDREARLAEEALALTREERREVQRNLAALGFEPRGIDGVLGPASRRAITDWQQQNGFPQTSFLDREQRERLGAQAARLSAQAEAEAERRRSEAEVADRAAWEETGARGDEAGLRAYLTRHPEGIYAGVAAERLATLDAANREAAQAEDVAAWDRARATDSTAALQGYLAAFPEGRFIGAARARLDTLVQAEAEARATESARAAEAGLALGEPTARVVEERLAAGGFNPGAVDGTFDAAARGAIRAYQEDRGLPVTGFLDQTTLARLLADTLGPPRAP